MCVCVYMKLYCFESTYTLKETYTVPSYNTVYSIPCSTGYALVMLKSHKE